MEKKLSTAGSALTIDLVRQAKRLGFSDADIAHLSRSQREQVLNLRLEAGLRSVYRTVDTCAAEFPARTPYYYSDYAGSEDEAPLFLSLQPLCWAPVLYASGKELSSTTRA